MLEKKEIILSEGEVCDHCLGRQFKGMFPEHSPEQIGAAVRKAKSKKEADKLLKQKIEVQENSKCHICSGVFIKVNDVLELLADKTKEYEFETFLVGTVLPKRIQANEEKLWTKIGAIDVEPIKRELNRKIRGFLKKETGKEIDFVYPDVIFLIDLVKSKIRVELNSLFIYGRYNKLVRDLPQTKWPCRNCNGRGCDKCEGTGLKYQISIEQLVAKPLVEMTDAKDEKFHGHGREDLDAKMLGNGRPFILELQEPKKRNIDMKEAEKKINKHAKGKIEVHNLRKSDKKEVQEIKRQRIDKSYHCFIECENEIDKEKFDALPDKFNGAIISQKTPKRVLEHRADKTRKRKIKELKTKFNDKKHFEIDVTVEGGTYIKEFISGDEGRTRPSLAGELDNKCKCIELDVTQIHELEK